MCGALSRERGVVTHRPVEGREAGMAHMDDAGEDSRYGRLVALLREEFGDGLLGVLLTGSRVHGTPGPTSDLDAHVIIAAPRRQRRNFVLDGLEVELFLNP